VRGALVVAFALAVFAGAPVAAAAPGNDDFEAAYVLPGMGGSVAGTTVGATTEECEPFKSGNTPGRHTVWYRWVAPVTGTARFEAPSGVDLDLDAYTMRGRCYFGGHDAIAWDHGETPPYMEFFTEHGRTYWITVWGEQGDFVLDYRLIPAAKPVNDDFDGALMLVDRAGVWGGTNAGASLEPGEPRHAGDPGGRSLWFRWTAPASGRAVFHTMDEDFDTLLAVYTGASVGALTPIAENDDAEPDGSSRVVFTASAGTTYRIAVDGAGGGEAYIDYGVTLRWNSGPPPPNNDFVNAESLTGHGGLLRAWSTGASKEPGEPNHAGAPGGASVWYRWTAPTTGSASFGLTETEWDPLFGDAVLGVYTGASVSTLTPVPGAQFYDWPDIDIAFPTTAGTTYYVAIDGIMEDTGSYLLNWVSRPPNDDFAGRTVVTGGAGRWAGSNDRATAEPGEPNHAGWPAEASIWFEWVAPASGSTTLDTYGGGWQTSLAVYTGSTLAGLTEVASNEVWMSGWSKVTFSASAGTSYKIAVDSHAYGDGIPISLNWRMAADREWTPPTVAWSGPPEGSRVNGTVTLSATASDNVGIDHMWFGVPEVWIAPGDRTAPYASVWDTTHFDDGTRQLGAHAVDLGSNQAAATRSLVVENYAPRVWASASPRGAVRTRDAGLAWNPTEAPVTGECSLNDAPFTPCGDVQWFYGLADGEYVWRVFVTDTSGKRSAAPGTAVWTIDTKPVRPAGIAAGSTPPGPPPPVATGTAGATYTVITGTARADVLVGTPGRDIIRGLGGRDLIRGLGGNDRLVGGAGRDRLYGGRGRDTFFARDRRHDSLYGGLGHDRARVDRPLDRRRSIERLF
jgi:hypothetical protein